MRSLATLRRVRNDAPVPLVSARGGGGALGGQSGAAAGDLLSKTSTVSPLFAVVNRTSTATAKQAWHLYRVPSDGRHDPGEDREEVTAHPAVDLWRSPNPFMSTRDLVETCQQHLDLVGETILVVTKVGKIPLELWPVRPDRMTPMPHPTQFLAGWIYRDPDGGKIPLNVDEVIQIKLPNPNDPFRGLGPVQALLADLDAMRYSAEWQRNFFLNSAEPGGVIELPTHLSDTQWDEFVARWREQHQGVSRAHRVAVVEYGGKYVPRGFSMADMQFAELRAMGRDTVYEAFGVSRATMGVTDGVNYAAAKAARTQFAELLTVPRLDRWQGGLNRQLLPMFEPPRKPGKPVKRTVEFDYDSPVENDSETENAERESKANTAAIYITAGFSPASVQEALGLPDMEYGTDEQGDPDRDLMISLVKAAPAALAPTLLPILLPDVEGLAEALKPPEPTPPPAGQGGPPGAGGTDEDEESGPEAGMPAMPPSPENRFGASPVRAADPVRAASLDELDAAWQAALDRLLDQWVGVTAAQRAELRRQITDAIDDDDLEALADLEVDSAHGARLLAEALDDLAQTAAAQVVATYSEVALTSTVPAAAVAVAAVVAALLASELAIAAGREALRIAMPGMTGAQVAGQVDAELRGRSDASPRAQLGGALNGAANRARVATMASGPIGSIYADETLDKNTCVNCRRINGRFVCNTDDLSPYDRLYTALGGYVDCLGGVRCRGTVTGVWRPQTTSQTAVAGAASFPVDDTWREEDHPRNPDGTFRHVATMTRVIDDYRKRVHGASERSERRAVNSYTGAESEGINAWLRAGADPSAFDAAERQPQVRELDRLMGRYATPEAITVYRYMWDNAVPQERQPAGAIISPRGYHSTTMNPELGDNDAPGYNFAARPVAMKINVPKGSNAVVPEGLGLGIEYEKEMILPQGTRFVVRSDERGDDGKRYMELDAIPPGADQSVAGIPPIAVPALLSSTAREALVQDWRDEVGPLDAGEQAGLDRYRSMTGSYLMNDLLRGKPTGLSEDQERQLRREIAALDALAGGYQTPETMTVRRFVDSGVVPESAEAGDVIMPRGMHSTTMAPSPGSAWNPAGTVMEIVVPQGSPAIVVGGPESEVVLPHETRFAIAAIEQREGKRWVTMTAIPPEHLL